MSRWWIGNYCHYYARNYLHYYTASFILVDSDAKEGVMLLCYTSLLIMIGGKQRIDKEGNPYGDPANLYDLVPNHVPKEWLISPEGLDKVSGKVLLVNRAMEISSDVSEKEIQKI